MADNTEGAMTDMEKGHQVGQSNTQSTVSPYDQTPEQLYGAPTYTAFTPVAPTAEPKQSLADIRRHTKCMYSCGIAYGILGILAGVSCLFAFSGASLGVGTCLIMFSIVLAVVGVVASKNEHPTVMLIVGIFLVLLSILAIAYALYLIYVTYVAAQAWFAYMDKDAEYINTHVREDNSLGVKGEPYPKALDANENVERTQTIRHVLELMQVPNGPPPPHPLSSAANAVRMTEVYRDRGLLCWFSKADILYFKKWPLDCDYYISPEGKTDTIQHRRSTLSEIEKNQLLYYSTFTGSAIYSTAYFLLWFGVASFALILCAVAGICLFPIAGAHGICAYRKLR